MYGEIPCLMLVTILHWGIPLSLSSSDILQILSLLSLFLDFYGSSHWGIPPSLGLSGLLHTFSLLDLFLDLCETSYKGIPLFNAILLGRTFSLGLPCHVLIS